MKKWLVAGVAALIVAGGAIFLLVRPHPPGPSPASVPASAPAASNAPAPPADCLLPGPPPVPPDGVTATGDDMRLGHDVMQAFVVELEAYQACRNDQIDHAAATVTPAQKQTWLEQGNDAVDEANALAASFGRQLKLFKDRNGGTALPP